MQTYKQLQEIRLYYDFNSVDVDRYHLDDKYTEVAVAARELPPSQLPARARTWVNMHLVYTHGYGVVMSPVNKFTPDGMPEFIMQDIPPQIEHQAEDHPAGDLLRQGDRQLRHRAQQHQGVRLPEGEPERLRLLPGRWAGCSSPASSGAWPTPSTSPTSTCCSRATSPTRAG